MDTLQLFADYLRIEEGHAERTINAYVKDVKRFRNWLDSEIKDNLPPLWTEVDARHIRTYLSHLQPGKAYTRRIISSLVVWFDYLVGVEKTRQTNPAREIKKPKLPKRNPSALTVEDTRRIIRAAEEHSRPSERLRNYSLIGFVVGSGLRRAETSNLGFRDITFQNGLPYSVRIIGKGNKEREVVLAATAQTALYQWLNFRQRLLLELPPSADRDAVWIIPAGPHKGKRMSPGAIYRAVRTCSEKAGIEIERVFKGEKIKVSARPHILRHTWFTEGARNGANLRTLADQGGQSSLENLLTYVRVVSKDREAMASVMPDFYGEQGPKSRDSIPEVSSGQLDELWSSLTKEEKLNLLSKR